ncbi:MAG: DUF1543 domain-containing protein [Sphingobacteriales bacterium]|nr:MAG: DUF1543 domain-containing protein [Sphingobacteriales bacterium]
MILLGCRPAGRHTEQHDIFFTIADGLAAAKPDIRAFWPDAGTIHIDGWRAVTWVNGYSIRVVEKGAAPEGGFKLFFVNLGGYKPGEFEEYHYKMLVVASSRSGAISAARATAFYKHTGFKGADSHIDDKYGIDVDDIEAIEDILPEEIRSRYSLRIEAAPGVEDDLHLGYLKWARIGAEE